MKTLKQPLIVVLLLMTILMSFGFRNHKTQIDIRDNDSLRIEFVGTKSHRVIVDNKIKCSKGSVFLANQHLKLSKGEYLKVTNKRTGASFYISHKDFKLTGTSSASTYIKKRYAAGKGKSDFGSILQSYPWQMVNDSLIIPTSMKLDNKHGFILKTIPGNMKLSPIPFDPETNELVLTKRYFLDNNIQLKKGRDYTFHVEYWADDENRAITNCFVIQYIPRVK